LATTTLTEPGATVVVVVDAPPRWPDFVVVVVVDAAAPPAAVVGVVVEELDAAEAVVDVVLAVLLGVGRVPTATSTETAMTKTTRTAAARTIESEPDAP